MWKTYFTPATVDEALDLLGKHSGSVRIIAGGTDLLLELEAGARPGVRALIDVTRIPGLDRIALGEDGLIHIGPNVTHNHVIASPLIRERAFLLAQTCWQVGSPQLRNRATVAGNLLTASPANDTIAPLRALGGQVTLRSAAGERVVPLADFYTGVRKTVMQPDELLIDIAFPPLADNQRGIFIKIGLRHAMFIQAASVAVVLTLTGDGAVSEVSITLGSVAPTIINAPEAEAFLIGKTLDEATIAGAARLASQAARPIDDVRGSATYRHETVRVLAKRALQALRDGKEREGFPENPVMLWGAGGTPTVSEPLSGGLAHAGDDVIETTVNGRRVTVRGAAGKTLLHMLRDNLGLTGAKAGCEEGECGACTVFLDGAAVLACLTPAPRAHGAEVVTIEGIARDGELHPVQQAFIDENAVQCGYCTPGFVMSGVKLLEERPAPTRPAIRESIVGNLCRCTGYYSIVNAIEHAAELAKEAR
jgi:xanthine dehydrogenase iron-sulfur cluster and FAD-binding subunit A